MHLCRDVRNHRFPPLCGDVIGYRVERRGERASPVNTSVSCRIPWKSTRIVREPGCQIAQVVTVDVDRWTVAWAATTTVVPAGEFSPSPSLSLFLSLFSSLPFHPPSAEGAQSLSSLIFSRLSASFYPSVALHWHVVSRAPRHCRLRSSPLPRCPSPVYIYIYTSANFIITFLSFVLPLPFALRLPDTDAKEREAPRLYIFSPSRSLAPLNISR